MEDHTTPGIYERPGTAAVLQHRCKLVKHRHIGLHAAVIQAKAKKQNYRALRQQASYS